VGVGQRRAGGHAAGLLVWALAVTSDQHSTQDELTSAQQQLETTDQELDQTKQDLEQQQQSTEAATNEADRDGGAAVAAGGLAAAKDVYDDLTEPLGVTETELAQTEQDLEDANTTAKQAEQDAAAAQKTAAEAGNETDKAKAEADKAKADAKAAESNATVVAECAKAYFGAFGALFEGDDLGAQAPRCASSSRASRTTARRRSARPDPAGAHATSRRVPLAHCTWRRSRSLRISDAATISSPAPMQISHGCRSARRCRGSAGRTGARSRR
jgi:hypothetical protein